MAKRKREYKIRPSYNGHYDILSGGLRRISNFDRARKKLLSLAALIYNIEHNDAILIVRNDAPYSVDGKAIRDCNSGSPHCSLWGPDDHRDLSDFWAIYEELKSMTGG